MAERHQDVPRDEVRVAFHPLVGLVGPAAIVILSLGDGCQQLGPPVVLFAVRQRCHLVNPHGVEALGHAVIVIVQPATLKSCWKSGVAFHGVVLLNPLVGLLDSFIVLGSTAVNQALDPGVGHAAIADQVAIIGGHLGLAAGRGAVDEAAV